MWPEKHGPSWRIRDEVNGRKVTLASGYRTKTAARDAITQLKAERLRGDALVPRGGRMTLADWISVWQPTWERGLKPSSSHSEPARVRNHILPLLGDYPLDEVDTVVVRWWIGQLSAGHSTSRKPLAAKTVRNVHGVLHSILAAAVDARLVRSNPCTGKGLPRRVYHEMRFLTEPEIARLVAHVPAHWRPLVLLLIATGLRWGEAVGLRAKWVDLLAKPPRLTVVEALHELPTGEVVFTDPKTGASRRTVTFTAKTAAALAGLVAKDRDELVFLAPRGGPPRIRNFRRGWVKWCAAAGLDGLRVHDLRHTHAALLISAGVPLTGVQRRLGHSSIAVTSDLYGHLLPVVDEGIIAAVEAALAAVDIDAEVDVELATL